MSTKRRTERGAAGSANKARTPGEVGQAAGAISNHDRKSGPSRRRQTWKPQHLVAVGAVVAIAVAVVVLLVRTSGPSSPAPVSATDFRIVAYQGDDVLGGHESVFSHVTSQGKPVVLNFFAGQCPPCRAEMPGFQRVADDFQGRVIFVGVDLGPYVQLGTHADARALLSQLKMRYPAAYAVDPAPLTIYGVQGMPTTVVFDSKGQVVDSHSGFFTEAQLRARLSSLVGQ